MKSLHYVTREQEWNLIQQLIANVDCSNFDPADTVILMVSPDYSATVAMVLAHAWSVRGETIPIIAVDVPYPDQGLEEFRDRLINQSKDILQYKKIVCVEAGIIRGSNWAWILDTLQNTFKYQREDITLVALCENIHSKVKSDYVGEYYDNDCNDLTFYYERFNKHWK